MFAGLLLLLLLGLLLLKTAKCHRLADDDRKPQRNGDESARQSVGRSVGVASTGSRERINSSLYCRRWFTMVVGGV